MSALAPSKYDPLRMFLSAHSGAEVPVTFRKVEELLGFRLPPSARRHPAWWSNNVGTNVAVKAWRAAGWKTSRVDIGGENVTFVRDPTGPRHVREQPTAARDAEASPTIEVPMGALTASALKMLQEKACGGGDLGRAAADLLQELVIARRKALIDSFTRRSTGMTSDSVDLIREGRDER